MPSTTHTSSRHLRDTLVTAMALTDPYDRANAVTQALGWNSAGTEVEWTPVAEHLGHFAMGGFPTSAAIVADAKDKPLWEPAWHAGARWCIATPAHLLKWYDLKNRLEWTGTPDTMTDAIIEGLRPSGFAQCGQMRPREVTPIASSEMRSESPSQVVAEQIKRWWALYLEKHARAQQTAEVSQAQKDEFTRFVAGILLLRTIEDLDRVKWLRPNALRNCSNAAGLEKLVKRAATELNSRVLRGISNVPFALAQTMIQASYEIGIDFGALDVDPVGAFYEEILGVGVEHQEKEQRSLFGENVKTTKDRNARRAKGVYYTPRIYADTLARMTVRPRVRTAENMDELPIIADIAAGSGELLCAALREILIEPAWCKPEVAWHVLDSKIQAIDENPLAPQLCALNLLRTAIRHVPELLTMGRRLPSLEQNLRRGDALHKTTLDAVPSADVILINPPFHALNRWQPPDAACAIPELYEIPARPHQALAFFAAATRLAKPGAALGVVMPSTLFTGTLSAPWRAWIAERVRLDMVVSNLGTPFRDIHSYAGLVIGVKQREVNQWRPRTRIIEIRGLLRGDEWDTGVLLADSGERRDVVESRIVPPLRASAADWVGRERTTTPASLHKKPLSEVLGDTFHQGVVMAPALWSEKLFLFQDESPRFVKHVLSGKSTERSALLRPFAKAKKLTNGIPLWCEPDHAGTWAFVPPGGGLNWFDVETLRKSDPAGYRIGKIILESILDNDELNENEKARQFVENAKHRQLRFRATNGYQDNDLPMIYASRASVTAASRDQGRGWYAWVNVSGGVLPASGLQVRAPRPEFAAALVAWMSIDELIQPLIDAGSPRRDGSVEFILSHVATWPIPDLRADRLQSRLDELYSAFLAYREEAANLRPKEALQLDAYREVQALARALWNEG